jgi:hypothetical protein
MVSVNRNNTLKLTLTACPVIMREMRLESRQSGQSSDVKRGIRPKCRFEPLMIADLKIFAVFGNEVAAIANLENGTCPTTSKISSRKLHVRVHATKVSPERSRSCQITDLVIWLLLSANATW